MTVDSPKFETTTATRWCIMLDKYRKTAQAAGCLGYLVIVILSLVPGSARPQSGAGGVFEHVAAYFLVAALLGATISKPRSMILLGLLMASGAGILEILQIFIPGRTPELMGFFAGALGIVIGLGLVSIIRATTKPKITSS